MWKGRPTRDLSWRVRTSFICEGHVIKSQQNKDLRTPSHYLNKKANPAMLLIPCLKRALESNLFLLLFSLKKQILTKLFIMFQIFCFISPDLLLPSSPLVLFLHFITVFFYILHTNITPAVSTHIYTHTLCQLRCLLASLLQAFLERICTHSSTRNEVK